METFEKFLDRCEAFLLCIAAVCALLMMCLTTADAAGRYIFNSPITGAYEITEKYLMPAMVFFGLGYAYRGGIFIRVTFVADRLPGRWKLCVDYIAQLTAIVCCLLLIVASTQQAFRVIANATNLSTMAVPIAPAYFFVPLGLLLLVASMLIDVPRVRSGLSRLFKEGSPDA